MAAAAAAAAAAATATVAAGEDDAAKKKKTDCVYFLASPLTCKKGNECEFRHSENARVNPRDCRYWLTGNCLHRDCPFRHPPLDGRPVAQTPTGTTGIGRVPCYYYLQGFCAKGDKCAFMHGAPTVPSVQTALSQKTAKLTNPNAFDQNEKQTIKTEADASSSKPITSSKVEPRSTASHTGTLNLEKAESSEVKDGHCEGPLTLPNGFSTARLVQESSGSDSGKDQQQQDYVLQSRHENSHEPEEMLEASSPPFDVLVDDGPDQLLYAEDGEYHSSRDYHLDSGQVIYGEDADEYDYQYLELYGHEGAHYGHEHYDDHEQLGEFKANMPRHALWGYDDFPDRNDHRRGAMNSEYLLDKQVGRDKISSSVERESGRVTGVNDLRNHIVQRRRQEKSENRSRMNFTERSPKVFRKRRLQDDRHSERVGPYKEKLHDQHVRSRDKKLHVKTSRLGKRIGGRLKQDITSDPSPRFTEKYSNTKPRTSNEHDHGWVGSRLKGRIKMNSHLSDYVESQGGLPSLELKKGDITREAPDFVGPKSLEQIRAEKRKNGDEDNTNLMESSRLKKSRVDRHSRLPFTSKDATLRTYGMSGNDEPKKLAAFESPKPLSALLKSKQKLDSGDDVSTVRHISSEIEKASVDDRKHYESYDSEWRIRSSYTAVGKCDMGSHVSSQYVKDDLDDISMAEAGISSSIPSDADTFGPDYEEEDDFAKKLGGFFS